MSDSEDSTVTYTQISSPFAYLLDIGSPGVDGPPIMPEDPYAYIVAAYQAPPSPDYMPGPEEPQSPPPLDFVPEPMYPEYMPLEDEILPAEEQPLPAAASPTTDSPGYVPESDPEEDDEDPEEDPADYPADRDDDDEEEEEPSGDDADDEDEDEEEEEEHPALADSVPPVHRMTARISIRDEPSISLPPREEVERLLALTTPPPSPLTPLSLTLLQIPSPPLLVSPPASVLPVLPPASPTHPLGYRAAMIRLRAETPSTSHPLPLPTSSPPLWERVQLLLPLASLEVVGQTMGLSILWMLRSDDGEPRRSAMGLEMLGLGASGFSGGMGTLHGDHMRQEEIATLQTFDRTRQKQLVQTLTLMQSLQGQHVMQTELAMTAILREWVSEGLNTMETVFRISYCSVENQIKFSTCTLLAGALTWWNSHVRIVGHDAAYVMTWTELKKKMADKYCPRNKMKKLEAELWNLEVQGTDVTRYNQHFQELALLCVRMFPEESDKVKRYVGGLPDMIHGSVVASKPKTMQEATEMATELMDKKIRTFAERQAANKRKFEDTSRNNQNQ
ncbi:reverse transcriptase domain-containing protein [Tanacetum coccineum]|uniref:Reverse transcriptase domain-containing protein n=1 Tax=Tanacetum coccineum TaxID=301880 RepID=A0ABQ5DHI4_9ASTR